MAGRKPLNPESRKGYDGKNVPVFCAKVRIRRLQMGITQDRLAEAIAAKKQRISELEGGHMIGDCDRIIAIARALETTPDYLFGFREEP